MPMPELVEAMLTERQLDGVTLSGLMTPFTGT